MGVLTAAAYGVGIFVLIRAFSLRSAHRGARIVLTAFTALALASVLVSVAAAISGETPYGYVLLALPVGAAAVAATFLMWRTDANVWFQNVRES